MYGIFKLRVLLAIVGAVTAQSSGSLPTATISNGVIIGTTTTVPSATASVNKFLGIPYQQSPPLRFGPPEPAPSWQEPRNASAFGDICIQQYIRNTTLGGFAKLVASNATQSEDCMYLNVWQPGGAPPVNGWPVMFWIYGGALQFGSSSELPYDGTYFAAFENVVFVSFNYRLNAFGFPGSPQLPRNETNLGFLDQRFALEWVQTNIANFSGDPTRVTIFGESAGAFSVDALLTVPPAKLPFRAAILESGSGIGNVLSNTGTNANQSWAELVAGVNCSTSSDTLECVRSVPATAIQEFIEVEGTSFAPLPDNQTFTNNVIGSRLSKKAAQVPIMIGTNADEGTLFTFGQNNLTAFATTLLAAVPQVAAEIIQRYAVGTPGVGNDSQGIARAFGDFVFVCPAALVANESASTGNPTWRYSYASTFPNSSPIPQLGVYHSSEIAIVFSTYSRYGATPQQYALSEYMRGAWGRFARNPEAGPGWNAVGTFDGIDLGILGGVSSGVTVVSPYVIDARCDIFNGLYQFLAT